MNTLNFAYQQGPFDQWIHGVAATLGTSAENNTIKIPKQAGEGYVKAMAIQPGLSFAMGNFLCNVDVQLQIKDNDKNGYILYFRKLDIQDKYVFYLGDVMKETSEENYEAALLLSSRMDHSFEFKKGTQVMSLAIYMEEEWMNNNIDPVSRERLQEYVANGINNYNKEVLTAKHKRIIETMLREDLKLPLSNLFLQTRAYRLTENF